MKTIHASRNLLLLAAIIAVAPSQISRAQIGSGWTQWSFQRAHDFSGGTYVNSGGVETFTLGVGDIRQEIRCAPDHHSGQYQFEGYAVCSGTPRSTGASIQQVYQH